MLSDGTTWLHISMLSKASAYVHGKSSIAARAGSTSSASLDITASPPARPASKQIVQLPVCDQGKRHDIIPHSKAGFPLLPEFCEHTHIASNEHWNAKQDVRSITVYLSSEPSFIAQHDVHSENKQLRSTDSIPSSSRLSIIVRPPWTNRGTATHTRDCPAPMCCGSNSLHRTQCEQRDWELDWQWRHQTSLLHCNRDTRAPTHRVSTAYALSKHT